MGHVIMPHPTSISQHEIRLKPGSKVVKSAPYRCNPKIRKEISKQVQEMLDQGIIQPSESHFSSLVFMVTKPNGYRFCVDYRAINKITIVDRHPIGRVDDSLDSFSKASIFSKIDLQSGFCQQEIHPNSRHFTAFCFHEGLFKFRCLPFGLKNSPSNFARLIRLF